MTWIFVVLALAVFAVALVLVYLRLRWWARRYAEAEKLLAVYEEREGTLVAAGDARAQTLDKAALALFYLWPTVRVETPERRVSAAALLTLFPRLEAAGGLTKRDVTCPKCSDVYCLAPGGCDDPEHFFGGIGP
ncbi:hypothetical protein [Myxococcus sp. NMCA1]|uniref:hypothetical protein n=1 Tax=Myxococcus sp. NMCA1 TaxID=2996785 RepID=UPI0022869599|nr:hypothetical protein [Myxococcus sp. NMCA1]WAM23844.1 hypothetical protein OZ403_25215 [Myxococcus sp. NMCA1]